MGNQPHISGENPHHAADPVKTAEALLDAYYFQDQRESAIVQNQPDAAADAATTALSRMAEVFQREFPNKPTALAGVAGKEFMRGLFVQDEIENHHIISNLSLPDFEEVLLSDPTTDQPNPAVDDRWDVVRHHLDNTCDAVGIDRDYSELQTRFWLLHGQLNEYWEEVAKQAHQHKLEAMLGPVSAETHEKLGSYFVTGVKIHDDWTHRNKEADFEEVESIVTKYYECIFDLQAES